MIMGAGKTTVVAPLLALMLADGEKLVLSVVPKALLEMSRKLMRETFASIMPKRIYTLKYDRSAGYQPAMCRALENAARNRGIVVATPTTVKSVMLVFQSPSSVSRRSALRGGPRAAGGAHLAGARARARASPLRKGPCCWTRSTSSSIRSVGAQFPHR